MKTGAAIVVRIASVTDHPNADRLDVVLLERPYGFVQVVTGKHYRAGSLAVWFKPDAILPGWLAEEMWLPHGKPFEVREMPIRGQGSAGIIAGEVWRETPDREYKPWRFWRSSWKAEQDLSDYLGVWLSA